jgi:hypothetical protein
MGMEISKAWANYEISAYGELQKQQLMSLQKKLFGHKESSCHKAAIKLADEAQKEMLEKVCMISLSCEKDITAKVFCMAYKVAGKNQSFSNFEDEVDV